MKTQVRKGAHEKVRSVIPHRDKTKPTRNASKKIVKREIRDAVFG